MLGVWGGTGDPRAVRAANHILEQLRVDRGAGGDPSPGKPLFSGEGPLELCGAKFQEPPGRHPHPTLVLPQVVPGLPPGTGSVGGAGVRRGPLLSLGRSQPDERGWQRSEKGRQGVGDNILRCCVSINFPVLTATEAVQDHRGKLARGHGGTARTICVTACEASANSK